MRLRRVVKHRGMELHKLHISHRSLGTIDHRDAVARSDNGVRGGEIDGTTATCTHDGNLRQIGIDLLRLRIQHISTIALDIG